MNSCICSEGSFATMESLRSEWDICGVKGLWSTIRIFITLGDVKCRQMESIFFTFCIRTESINTASEYRTIPRFDWPIIIPLLRVGPAGVAPGVFYSKSLSLRDRSSALGKMDQEAETKRHHWENRGRQIRLGVKGGCYPARAGCGFKSLSERRRIKGRKLLSSRSTFFIRLKQWNRRTIKVVPVK